MVFKGELFFLDSEASSLISRVFTNKKDKVLGTNWLLFVLFADEKVSNMVQINVIEWQNRQNQIEIHKQEEQSGLDLIAVSADS